MVLLCSGPTDGNSEHTLSYRGEHGRARLVVLASVGDDGLQRLSRSFDNWQRPRRAMCLAFSRPVPGWRGYGGGA